MNKPDWSIGFRIAVFLFATQVGLAVGYYLLGCWIYLGWAACSINGGLGWILSHPLFSISIPVATAFGFLIGAFSGLMPEIPFITKRSDRFKGIISWTFVILLIAAFALWGVPDWRIVWGSILEAK